MTAAEPTLHERALRMHRRLRVLGRVFENAEDLLDVQDLQEQRAALFEGVRDMVAELADDSRIISSVPSSFGQWRPDDDPLDARWRTISQLERRETLQMVRAYEDLISCCETLMMRTGADDSAVDIRWHQNTVARFKSEASFLLTDGDARPGAQESPSPPSRVRTPVHVVRAQQSRE